MNNVRAVNKALRGNKSASANKARSVTAARATRKSMRASKKSVAPSRSEATYLYCVVHSGPAPSLEGSPPGLADTRNMRALSGGEGLWLIAADAPLPAYDARSIDARLSDLDWVAACALAHEQVVEHFAAQHTVIPMKLFTLFSGDERAILDLTKRRRRLARVLQRVEGREEWGLRVIFDEVRAARDVRASLPHPTSGTSFLVRKRGEHDALHGSWVRERDVVDHAYGELSHLVDEARRRTAEELGAGSRVLLDAAFLVRGESRREFKSAVEALKTRLEEGGCAVTLTGPWPPYNFIQEPRT